MELLSDGHLNIKYTWEERLRFSLEAIFFAYTVISSKLSSGNRPGKGLHLGFDADVARFKCLVSEYYAMLDKLIYVNEEEVLPIEKMAKRIVSVVLEV